MEIQPRKAIYICLSLVAIFLALVGPVILVKRSIEPMIKAHNTGKETVGQKKVIIRDGTLYTPGP